MSTPFGLLVAERSNDLERACSKALEVLNRYAGVSSNQRMSLDEASWLASIVFIAMNDAQKQQFAKKKDGNVINVIADSSAEASSNAS